MAIQDLIHTYDTLAWRRFSSSLKDKKYGLFKVPIHKFVEHWADSSGNWSVDSVLHVLKINKSSDNVIVVSEKAFKELQLHRYSDGRFILKQLDDGLFRYKQHIVLKCKDGARIQDCCPYMTCANYRHSDFIICPIDAVDVIE